ncbi:hypothetical protein ACJMK2_039950 [Sinanodonta woodiana]|uniref:F-box domain-containing protein n=1 Tax=Sinanodonta woodiana TaxID=1069815 RepID=A0ABD3WDH1_SINWO
MLKSFQSPFSKADFNVVEDETVCGVLCQHPSCWQSNLRRAKGFPHHMERKQPMEDIELDLPTVKMYNMLEDYGESESDKYPAKHGGKPLHERSSTIPDLNKPIRTTSFKMTTTPQPSPKSVEIKRKAQQKSVIKLVQVQEVYEPEDLHSSWDATFIPKKYYVWVPGKKKKKKRQGNVDISKGRQSVQFRDLTEHMIPPMIEEERQTSKKKRSRTPRSPTSYFRGVTSVSPRGFSTRVSDVDPAGVNELIRLPREVFVQVLEHSKESDFMSRDKLNDLIQRFMPMERGNTNISITSHDLLHQKKINLQMGNKNIRQPQVMGTKPIYYLDDESSEHGRVDSPVQESPDFSDYGLYLSDSRGFSRYKKIPAIRKDGSKSADAVTKLPSVSLGLPELPTGIHHTRPFTYRKHYNLDFTLAPVPTPPTSIRDTETPASEHGTTIRVNVTSTQMSDSGTVTPVDYEKRYQEAEQKAKESEPSSPIHAVSPSFSTRVPQAPATTPYQQSPTKSTRVHDLSRGSTMTASPPDGVSREKLTSPGQIKAPVNTPGGFSSEQTGLDPIAETAREYSENGNGTNSSGRSVRFEIPEVPPPPSTPQDNYATEGYYTGEIITNQNETKQLSQANIHKNQAAMNTSTPRDQPMISIKLTTNETSINAENTNNKTPKVIKMPQSRELSMISTPELWPAINEADYDTGSIPDTDVKNGESSEMEHQKKEHEKKKSELDSTYVNKVTEKDYVVKKIMEESHKAESPAPPPPSPEQKDEDASKEVIPRPNSMSTVLEEGESAFEEPPKIKEAVQSDGLTMVLQVAPKGGKSKDHNKTIDTFVNIDIPATVATFDHEPNLSVSHYSGQAGSDLTETESKSVQEKEGGTRDVRLSIQSYFTGLLMSEHTETDVESSLIEPAMSEASQGPAMSDFTNRDGEKEDILRGLDVLESTQTETSDEVKGDNSNDNKAGNADAGKGDNYGDVDGGNTVTEDMNEENSADLQMTEEGGDHEGFKEELRQEYERLSREGEAAVEKGNV